MEMRQESFASAAAANGSARSLVCRPRTTADHRQEMAKREREREPTRPAREQRQRENKEICPKGPTLFGPPRYWPLSSARSRAAPTSPVTGGGQAGAMLRLPSSPPPPRLSAVASASASASSKLLKSLGRPVLVAAYLGWSAPRAAYYNGRWSGCSCWPQ